MLQETERKGRYQFIQFITYCVIDDRVKYPTHLYIQCCSNVFRSCIWFLSRQPERWRQILQLSGSVLSNIQLFCSSSTYHLAFLLHPRRQTLIECGCHWGAFTIKWSAYYCTISNLHLQSP